MIFLAAASSTPPPTVDALPAPLWLVTALHLLTLALHFLAMNFLLGGLLTTLVARIPDRWRNPTVRLYLRLFPIAMAATVTLGVAPLLFAQLVFPEPLYSAAIVSGWFWVLIPIVVIVAYYFLYGAALAREGSPKVKVWLWVAVLGLLYVSVVYSSVFSLAEHPAFQKELYASSQSGLVLNPDVGSWIVRWLHMITGALAVGAFFFGWLARNDEAAFAGAKKIYLHGFVGAAIVGVAYLATLGDVLPAFMRSAGIWGVMAGLLAGLGALALFFQRRFVLAGVLNLVAVLGMVVARHVLRLVVLEGAYDPATIPVRPQWGVFAIFLVCFLLALGLIAWMLRLFFTDRPATT